MQQGRAAWIKRLRLAAEATLGSAPTIPAAGAFRDEQGNQLETDGPLMAALRGDRLAEAVGQERGGDVALWTGAPLAVAVQPDVSGAGVGGAGRGREGRALLRDWTDQPLGPSSVGMEVWGERELCGLHALWWRARVGEPSERDWWLRRGRSACCWLLENLQPDNATNLPWSVHVWAMVAHDGPWGQGLGPEAEFYAQTLLHNAQVGGARAGVGERGGPDQRSAWILFHAARELEIW